ncbi:Leucine rich repeat containing protein BspA family protein [Entamoeba marina]
MSSTHPTLPKKSLDRYSIMIAGKFLQTRTDFINLISVSKNLSSLTEMYRYNPVSITSLNLFPKIQTQHLYKSADKPIEGLYKYVVWHKVSYKESLKYSNVYEFKKLVYTHNDYYAQAIKDDRNNVLTLPPLITEIDNQCFQSASYTKIIIPSTVKSLGKSSFNSSKIKSIDIPSSVTAIRNFCFANCSSLTSVTLPTSLTSFGYRCFGGCTSLRNQLKDIPKHCW